MLSAPLASSRTTATGGRAPYLFIRRNVPTFRIRIPTDIQACLGRTEYRRSLGPCYVGDAKLKALRLATAALEVFAFAREAVLARTESLTRHPVSGKNISRFQWSTSGSEQQEKKQVSQGDSGIIDWSTPGEFQGRALSSLTDEEIRSVADGMLLFALKSGAMRPFLTARLAMEEEVYGRRYKEPIEMGDPELDALLAKLDDEWEEEEKKIKAMAPEEQIEYRGQRLSKNTQIRKEQFRRALMSGRPDSEIARVTDFFLNRAGIEVDPATEGQAAFFAIPPEASMPYLKAYQEILKAHVTLHDISAKSALGDYTAHDEMVERLEQKLEARREKRRIKVSIAPKVQPQAAAHPPVVVAENEGCVDAKSIKLSEAIEEMFREKSLDGSWTPKVQRMEREKFKLFQAIVDPEDQLAMGDLGAKHVNRYKEIVLQLPTRRNQKAAYRDLDTPALLHLIETGGVPASDRIKTNTIKTYFQSATALIHWAAKHEHHKNPVIADNLEIKADKQPHEYRDPFSDQDIARMFTPDSLIRGTTARERNRATRYGVLDSGGKASRFWVPLLGLFTGARLEELAQLHTDDIVLVNRQGDARTVFTPGSDVIGVAAEALAAAHGNGTETLCLFINKGKPYQRLKNAASRRYVPLSPVLADDLSFLDYAAWIFSEAEQARVEGRPAPGDGRLFPELSRKHEHSNFAHELSKWFNKYRVSVGVKQQEGRGKKDFHSFRHTLSRWCEQNGVTEKSTARHLGHSHDTMTFGRYSTDTAPHFLYDAITKGFSDYGRSLLDLKGLKASKWASFGSSGGKATSGAE